MSGSTSTLFAWLARATLILTLVAAPWPFGGYPDVWQPPIFAGILVSLACWWIATLTRPLSHSDGGTILVDSLLPPVLLVVVGGLQLIPFANVPEVPAHAVLAEPVQAELDATSLAAPTPISVAPALTRVTAARLLFGIAAAFLGIQLFRDASTRLWLYWPLALNAAVMAAFGMWQKAHWKEWGEMMFGVVPISSGGQPFGPYVNRNNGAGLLNMGAAAAAAWAFLAAAPRVGTAIRRSDSPGPHNSDSRPSVIVPAIAFIVILAGVTVSLSRGGILAMAAALLAALVVLLQTRRARMVVTILFVILPAVALAVGWFGFGETVRKRFAVLNSYTYQEGRFQHWQETWGAVQDAPWLGQGLGAYRYINRPYQQTDSERWYVNADNQFFELLVENGALGVLLVLATILLLTIDIRRLLESRAPWEQRDAALLGAILLTSQAVQGLTDFGIVVPANLLTAGTLAGVVAGTAARSLPFLLVPNVASPMVFRRGMSLLLGVALLAGAGLAWQEIRLTANASAAAATVRSLDSPDAIDSLSLDAQVSTLQNAALDRPDDAELQRTLGNLLTFRFRRSLLEGLKSDPASKDRPTAELWAATSLEALFSAAVKLENEPAQTAFRQVLERADATESLPRAKDAYESALAGCRWVAASAQRNALTQFIVDFDTASARRSIALAAAGAPQDAERLIILGSMAQQLRADDLAIALWHRALDAAPRKLPAVMALARDWIRQGDRLLQVLPHSVDGILEFAESPDGTVVAPRLAIVAEQLVAESGGPEEQPARMARIRRLQGRLDESLQWFEKAIRDEPLTWLWRFKAAEVKWDLGRREEALKDFEQGAKDFPRQPAFLEKWSKLREPALPPSR
jgi:O-antigen ligase/tetratricopeptide (TPR) repeat protein